MKIVKTPKFKRDYKKLKSKHMNRELERVELIENLMIYSDNFKELLLNPLSKTYNIEKKKQNLKEIYTAKINKKIRLLIKPIGDYPYSLEEIVEVEFQEIDDTHYGDG
jgi:plasmid maintenance system killer protein